jgi:hypothetical protein
MCNEAKIYNYLLQVRLSQPTFSPIYATEEFRCLNYNPPTHTEGVWEHGAEENIWTEERWSDGRLEKTA